MTVDRTPATEPTYAIASYVVRPTNFENVHHPDKGNWCLVVADAGDGWAIRRQHLCLNYRNDWEFDPPPEARDDAFLARCRYNEFAALLRAKRVVDELAFEGLTFSAFEAQVKAEVDEQARAYLDLKRERTGLLRLAERLVSHRRQTSSASGEPDSPTSGRTP